MSSGAYFIEMPVLLIGIAALDAASTLQGIAEREREHRLQLEAESGRLREEFLRVQEASQAVLADIAQFRESLKTLNFQYNAKTATFTTREAGDSTEIGGSLDLESLMFMEVDVQTQQITYVVLDYSDAISIHSARNSAQFKKLSLASDLMKKVMVWVIEDPQEQMKLNQLINVVNTMLDDNDVSFNHFQQFVQMRFAEYQRMQDSLNVDMELWDRYCTLCAMRSERPKRLNQEQLVQEIRRLHEEATAEKFIKGARKAFMETVQEMGLEVQSDHMLDKVPGMLLVDKENPGYNLFFSEHDVSFMLEMVETGEARDDEKHQQHEAMCQKRRALEKRMLEKGYRLKLCATDDHFCASAAAVEMKKDTRESNAELLRRRRAVAGKQAKLKVAGGR